MDTDKPISLRPQDVVVVAKLAANHQRRLVLSVLAQELNLAVSVVHGCITRAELARLVSRADGSIRAVRGALAEFIVHGVRYAFPATQGATNRGVPTSVGAPVLAEYFDQGKLLPPVWPDPDGTAFGPMVTPLHRSVPAASATDSEFYALMALIDAIRTGAARERELASKKVEELLG